MSVIPICKELEDNYISLFEKAGFKVKIDEKGIHASTTFDNMCCTTDYVFSFLAEHHIPHSVRIDPKENVIIIIVRERYFKEEKNECNNNR